MSMLLGNGSVKKKVGTTMDTHETIKNCWKRHFLCGAYLINRNQAISSFPARVEAG
jgi:hypothetical protein